MFIVGQHRNDPSSELTQTWTTELLVTHWCLITSARDAEWAIIYCFVFEEIPRNIKCSHHRNIITVTVFRYGDDYILNFCYGVDITMRNIW